VSFWAYLAPIAATPVTGGGFSGRATITPMPSSEALAPCWIALLDGHLGIAVADGLALTTLASPDYELLWSSRGTPWAVTW